jgi:hypothetical protein
MSASMLRRPGEHEVTPLLLKAAMPTARRAAGLSVGDLITTGGQLLNLKHPAGRHDRPGTARVYANTPVRVTAEIKSQASATLALDAEIASTRLN